ncbi:hypothetical protein FQN54_001731 [Arachnomyces sp. PD_36]|nr:hypothetical protein FQN54_001731 [Arachnomyces sp. PD_36]
MGSCISSLKKRGENGGGGASSRLQVLISKSKKKGSPASSQILQKAEKIFQKTYPAYEDTTFIDLLRSTEYPTLDKDGHIYLDYTGGGLAAESQLRAHFELLRQNIYGNPHSLNPTSSAITKLDEQARASVLTYFNASPDEYAVIFTANASHALKLIGESYPFTEDGELLLLSDNHNSVHGIREFARAKGTKITYVPIISPDLRVDEESLQSSLEHQTEKSSSGPRLFAFPAQSNFSGVQHSLEWIETAQSNGWHVVLDAASFVPTNKLDLSLHHPDFVPLSFYKMFGYPSGIGCLLARKETLSQLNRPWFAGGTVWGSAVQADSHVLLEGHEGFEDGTINYLGLPAVHTGLTHLSRIGIETIHNRTLILTDFLLKTLLSLHHSNGNPLIQVYGPKTTDHLRGGTVTFNFLDPTGAVIDERIVDQRAIPINLSLRTGCFCNPGAGEAAFNLPEDAFRKAFSKEAEKEMKEGKEKKWDDVLADMGMPSGGGVRVSLGLMSNFADVYRFVEFASGFLDEVPGKEGLVPRAHC